MGKPLLQEVFEACAAAMRMADGQTRLEIVFRDGALYMWWTHGERRSPAELGRFDTGEAAALFRELLEATRGSRQP